jgi:hypothetical protein
MKEKQQMIEAMARCDGLVTKVDELTGQVRRLDHGFWPLCPDYFTDNEIDRMVRDNLNREQQWEYSLQLQKITSGMRDGRHSWSEIILNVALATEDQKVEAHLKATNNWSE